MVAEFGEAPDLFGDLLVVGGVGVDELEDLGVVGRELGDGGGAARASSERVRRVVVRRGMGAP